MKLTNMLLILLVAIVAFNKMPEKAKEMTVAKGITVGKTYKETKSITPTVLNKKKVKHATTFREYIDSDGRSTTSLNHSVRVGKEYYVAGGASIRQSSYGSKNVGLNVSLTKYW